MSDIYLEKETCPLCGKKMLYATITTKYESFNRYYCESKALEGTFESHYYVEEKGAITYQTAIVYPYLIDNNFIKDLNRGEPWAYLSKIEPSPEDIKQAFNAQTIVNFSKQFIINQSADKLLNRIKTIITMS